MASSTSKLSGSETYINMQRWSLIRPALMSVEQSALGVLTLTPNLADVQDISNDTVSNVGNWLPPGNMHGIIWQHSDSEALRSSGQVFRLDYRQTGAGLVGASAVFCDALVNGLVLWADTGQSQSTAQTHSCIRSLQYRITCRFNSSTNTTNKTSSLLILTLYY